MVYTMDMRLLLMDIQNQNVGLLHHHFPLILELMVEVNNSSHTHSMKISSGMLLKWNNLILLLTKIIGSRECSSSMLVICINYSLKLHLHSLPRLKSLVLVKWLILMSGFIRLLLILSMCLYTLTVNCQLGELRLSNLLLGLSLRLKEDQIQIQLISTWNHTQNSFRITTISDTSCTTSHWLMLWLSTHWTDFTARHCSVQDGHFTHNVTTLTL